MKIEAQDQTHESKQIRTFTYTMRNFTIILFLSIFALSLQTADKFSSPETLIETFISASSEQNKEVLSQCFSETAPGEWDAIRSKTITEDGLQELKEFVSGATITAMEMKSEDHAIVYVAFESRDETILTIKEKGRWYILDF